MAYLLGIDSGTTAVKATLFDEEKGVIANAFIDCSVSYNNGTFFEVDMEQYWNAFKKCISMMRKEKGVDMREVKALAISSQGVTFVPVDCFGRQLGKGIFLYDTRARMEADEIMSYFGEDKIYRITGQPGVSEIFEAPKLLWIRKHDHQRFENIHKVLLVHDYLVFKLTGKFISVSPLVSSSLLFDINRKKWWEEMIEFIGLNPKQLPDILDPGDVIGFVTGEAAIESGLSSNTLVVGGAIDQVCGMVGVGNIDSGIISESTGSVLAVHTVSKNPFKNKDAGIHNFCNAIKKTYALIGVCPTAGTALNWFKKNFYNKKDDAVMFNGNPFEQLIEDVKGINPGSEGLLMLPHLAGRGSPNPNSLAKGVFYGFRLNHTKGHFVRALMESIAYMLRSNIEVYQNMGIPVREIRSFGGGSKSGLWNQIKADVCGLPIITSAFDEPGCMGAVVLAGIGSKVYGSIEEACNKLVKLKNTIYPDGENNEIYEEYYQKYKKLNEIMDSMFEGNQNRRKGV
jgi:xylulokinase